MVLHPKIWVICVVCLKYDVLSESRQPPGVKGSGCKSMNSKNNTTSSNNDDKIALQSGLSGWVEKMGSWVPQTLGFYRA